MGNTGPKIEKILCDVKYSGTVIKATDMADAVKKASSLASEGDKVILSPAAASFDLYPNFMCRGKDFKEKVNEL